MKSAIAIAAAVSAAAAVTATTSAAATPPRCWSGYSYVGVESPRAADGVSATLTLRAPSQVSSGHAAAWVGVGGAGAGPHGADEWLQVGINRDAGAPDELYYEFKRPGDTDATYGAVGSAVVGKGYTVSVRETAASSWVASIDRRVVARVVLPRSHRSFAPLATSENWDGGTGACNGYDFRFGNLSLLLSSRWSAFPTTRVLRDRAYRFVRFPGGFEARS